MDSNIMFDIVGFMWIMIKIGTLDPSFLAEVLLKMQGFVGEDYSCKSENIKSSKCWNIHNPEDPCNQFSKILDMGSISIIKHEISFLNL